MEGSKMKHEYVFGENVEKEYPNVRLSIERITPELAREWLGANELNRTMPREPISNAISLGEWMMNGESIIFANDGCLLDGQTRLNACIVSGKPIESVIVRGINPKAQLVMDCGASRTLTAHLEMMKVKNAKVIAAITKSMYRLEHWGLESAISGTHVDMTTRTLIGYALDNEQEFQRLWKMVRNVKVRHSSITTGMIAVLASEFEKVDEEDCEEFLKQLSGETIPSQPVNLMIKKLDDDARSKTGKYPARTLGAVLIKAWNAYLNGIDVDMNYLRLRAGGKQKERFPEIAHY